MLSISNGIFYPSLNYQRQRRDIDMQKLNVQVHSEVWNQPPHERHSGVSAFGFGGTNFHVLLSGAPKASDIQFQPSTVAPASQVPEMPAEVWWCSAESVDAP